MYQNGQLLNKDGSRYEGEGVKVKKDGSIKITNSFLSQTVGALNKLGSTKDGSGMIADIQSSTFSLTINDAKFNPRIAGRNEYKADNTINASFYQGQNQKQGTFTDIGSGGNVYWNPTDSTVGTVNEVGGTGFRPVTNLGHEIFHGLDGINGNLDNSLNSYGLPVKEMRASYYENSMRSDLGYPMRSTYNNISILDGQGAPIYQPPPSVLNMIAN